jgi:hypothetical protein
MEKPKVISGLAGRWKIYRLISLLAKGRYFNTSIFAVASIMEFPTIIRNRETPTAKALLRKAVDMAKARVT